MPLPPKGRFLYFLDGPRYHIDSEPRALRSTLATRGTVPRAAVPLLSTPVPFCRARPNHYLHVGFYLHRLASSPERALSMAVDGGGGGLVHEVVKIMGTLFPYQFGPSVWCFSDSDSDLAYLFYL